MSNKETIAKNIKRLKAEITKLMEDQKIFNEVIRAKQQELKELENKLWFANNPLGIKVTDHALIRYLERKQDLDQTNINRMLEKDLRESSKNTDNKLPDGTYYCTTFRAVVKDGNVVTIY